MDEFHGGGVRTLCIIRSNILCLLVLVKLKGLLMQNTEEESCVFEKFTGS